MKRTNKYISLLALAAALIACNKVTVETNPDGKYRIAFDEVGVDTKAAITATDGISEFKVWGAVKENSDDADYENIFTGNVVEYKSDSEGNFGWIYKGEQYWKENSKYRFFAVSPISCVVKNDPAAMTYSFDYTMSGGFNVSDDDFNDVVVAQNSVETPVSLTSQPADVDMSFIHPFVKLRLHIAKSEDNADETMIVKEVRLTGVKNKGTYTYNIGTGVSEWIHDNSSSASLEYTNQSDNPLKVTDESGWIKLEFYALPQYVSDNQIRLEIDYQYSESGDTEMKSYNAYLPQTDVWQANKIITYKAELSVIQKIRFYISEVDTWGNMPSGTIIIQ